MADRRIIKKNIKLIIAGEFYESELEYKKLIKQLKLKNIIIYNQFIEDCDVPYFFSASNLVILPYISATQSNTAMHYNNTIMVKMAMCVLQILAMHYNKPMIVTKVGVCKLL